MPEFESADRAIERLRMDVRGRVASEEPIARYTSFRVGGPARIFVEPDDAEDLARVGKVASQHGMPTLIIGRGTNLLVSDRGFPGVVIRLGDRFDWISSESSSIEAGASSALPQVANRAARLSLTGMEFTVAIPATVGGAVRMNAGAHGSSLSDILESAVVCRLDSGTLENLFASDLQMKYRETSLSELEVVCSARFRLSLGSRDEIKAKMAGYRRHRSETQPTEAPNAGSMFRNPAEDAAGRLIEAAGLKGLRLGGAEISRKHANFFVAHQGAAAQDVFDLMARVQRVVEETSGILLEPEVRVVGAFERAEQLRHAK